ncbi:hypothetical protein U1Q18_040087 [Sarracenia purpurea var. burkii]
MKFRESRSRLELQLSIELVKQSLWRNTGGIRKQVSVAIFLPGFDPGQPGVSKQWFAVKTTCSLDHR